MPLFVPPLGRAADVTFTPAGTIAATDVQAAIVEVAAEAQPLDSDLTAIAALSTTSFGRALLALADAAAGRTAIGLGTAATHADTDFALLVANVFSALQTIALASDAKLVLKDTNSGGTAGVANPGANYIEFRDQDGDRQGYFGLNNVGDFIFAPEVAGGKIDLRGIPIWPIAPDSIAAVGTISAGTSLAVGTTASIGGTITGPGDSVDAFLFGASGRRKKLAANPGSSPWDSLDITALGSSGGWQGAISFILSYSAGTPYLGMYLRTRSDGAHADLSVTGDIIAVLAGSGLKVKEGTNAKMGVATLVAGTVTVSTTAVTANSRIFLTPQTLGNVAVPKALGVTGRTAATSFVITSADATDTSTVAWMIVEPA